MSDQHHIPDDPAPGGPHLPAAMLVFVLSGGHTAAELISTRHDGTQRREPVDVAS
jgi:hypothetical protein